MPNSKKPVIGYGPSKKTHIIANIVFGLIAVLIVVAIIALVKDKNRHAQNKKAAGTTSGKTPKEIIMGQTLLSRYFDVTINNAAVLSNITDSSGPVNFPGDKGIRYLVLEITLRNTDAESKMMPEGELQIESGSEVIKYRNPETVLAKGWGMLMENIEPEKLMKTRLVYKIPAGIPGKVYYYPDISYSGDRIFLISL